MQEEKHLHYCDDPEIGKLLTFLIIFIPAILTLIIIGIYLSYTT